MRERGQGEWVGWKELFGGKSRQSRVLATPASQKQKARGGWLRKIVFPGGGGTLQGASAPEA